MGEPSRSGTVMPIAARSVSSTDGLAWSRRTSGRIAASGAAGGFDHDVLREKTVAAVMDDIHADPGRRGLVDTPAASAWSSARFWEAWANVALHVDDLFG